jgi:hypothetical protein
MKRHWMLTAVMFLALGFNTSDAQFRPTQNRPLPQVGEPLAIRDDTSARPHEPGKLPTAEPPSKGLWGMDILISNDGFGLGVFYRKEFTPDISGFASFSISEAKDEREVDQIDPFTGVSYVPGKLNRFMLLPLMIGAQYRLFREDIVETFRPYVNAGAGPAMIYVMPYIRLSRDPSGALVTDQVEFFSAIGHGRPRYTAGGFVGFGANFGSEKTNMFGINFRYYFLYLFSDGVPSLYDINSGTVIATKNSFGGFFITLNVGVG